jgi:hypothetical protein
MSVLDCALGIVIIAVALLLFFVGVLVTIEDRGTCEKYIVRGTAIGAIGVVFFFT